MPKPKKIMWMSRHTPTQSQLDALAREFPGYVLCVDPEPFSSAEEIAARFRASGCDEMLVVAPYTVVRALLKQGIPLLHAEMQAVPCNGPDAEVIILGKRRRCYKFVRFMRWEGIDLRLSPLGAPAPIIHNPTVLLDKSGKTKSIIHEKEHHK